MPDNMLFSSTAVRTSTHTWSFSFVILSDWSYFSLFEVLHWIYNVTNFSAIFKFLKAAKTELKFVVPLEWGMTPF